MKKFILIISAIVLLLSAVSVFARVFKVNDVRCITSAYGDQLVLVLFSKNKWDEENKSAVLEYIGQTIGKDNMDKYIDKRIDFADLDETKLELTRPLSDLKHQVAVFKNRKSLQGRCAYENAQKLAREFPDSFDVPAKQELVQIKKGSIVKVCSCGERFWTTVYKVEGHRIFARVDNDLVHFEKHGLSYGDEISFKKDNVYSIWHNVEDQSP